jgi:pyridoxamine 5'-phosphate oxidase
LLKDVTADGFWFATMSSSPKGRDLDANGSAALVLYWREQGRQVRVTGSVRRGPRDVSDADFLQRHPNARATVLAGKQSEPMPTETERDEAVKAAMRLIASEPGLVAPDWSSYVLSPETVEFWQARREREQVRLRYRLDNGTWSHTLLWP